MAGETPDDDTYNHVYVYDISDDEWDSIPPPGQYKGKLQIINSKLTVIGGWDNATKKITNKVTTFDGNQWIKCYPNMLKARVGPGTVTHLDYVIVAGGKLEHNCFGNDIEILDYKQSSHWVTAKMKLPRTVSHPSLTISDGLLCFVGHSDSIGSTSITYQIPVDIITSTNQTARWTELSLPPYLSITIIPGSCPPVIFGSRPAIIGSPPLIFGSLINTEIEVDIVILDVPNNSWRKVSSLTSEVMASAIVSIDHDSILSIGGCTDIANLERAKIHSVTEVKKGTVTLDRMAATVGQTKVDAVLLCNII